MTKQDLIDRVFRTKGLPPEVTKKAVSRVVDAVFVQMSEYFVRAKVTRRETPRFTYPGFGTFTKKRREGRIGRNPQSGAPIEIPSKVTVAFTPGIELKGNLNHKGNHKK
jgi:DNA-binding protein HU-beta